MLLIVLFALTPFSADKVEILKEEGESIVHLIGHVYIEDESTTITCSEARFNETKQLFLLNDQVKIFDKNGEINAASALYLLDEKKGYLSGNVVLVTEQDTISSDSLFYDGLNESVEMFRNVKVRDHKNNLLATSQDGWYDLKNELGHLVTQPQLEIFRENKTPLIARAREFQLSSSDNLLYGFDSVVVIVDSITIYCDTFTYNLKTENGNLINPVIAEKNNMIRGKTGQFMLRNKELESFSVEDGWSRYYTDKGSENIVEGSKMSIFFKDGKASKITVEGKPKGLLNLQEESKDDVKD